MSSKDLTKKSTDTAVAPVSSAPAHAAPEGFQSVNIECPFYKHDSNEGKALQGALLARVDMPDAKDDDGNPKPWAAYLFRATAETRAVTRDGEVVKINVGDLVAVGASKGLEVLDKAPAHPTKAIEFWMMPGAKRKIPGTPRTFVPWDIKAAKKPVDKGDAFLDFVSILPPSDVQVDHQLEAAPVRQNGSARALPAAPVAAS